MHTAIQVAKLSKFSPIITTASPHNEALLKSLGATHVLDRSLPASTLAAEVAQLAGGKPIELVYDAVSLPDTQTLGYEVLAPGGVLVITNPVQVPEDKKKAGDGKKIVNVFGSCTSLRTGRLLSSSIRGCRSGCGRAQLWCVSCYQC